MMPLIGSSDEHFGHHYKIWTIMILEAQAARHSDAVAGRALLTARLRGLPPAERKAFHKAVRACFASRALAAANEN
jgi:hypothetical protein